MASGDVVATIQRVMPPLNNSAHYRGYGGGSTPNETNIVLSFDAATKEYMDYLVRMHANYANGGVNIKLPWSADTATTGSVVWGAAFRAYELSAEVTSGIHTYGTMIVADVVGGTLKYVEEAVISLANGASMDNFGAGDIGIMRIWRDAAHASDTMSGDAFLHEAIEITEQ